MSETRIVPVDTPSRSYEVYIGRGLLASLGALVTKACPTAAHVALVSDSNVAPLYAPPAAESLRAAGLAVTTLPFPAGEEHKRLSTLGDILERMAQAGLTRADAVVAVGGGVTGDMGGLAAALYQRGIQVVQVPTSLLAMVDSSVGGKTAVDLEAGKNLAGAFLQPSLVVADVDCLATVSPDLLRDSCGEMIKHGVLADERLFERLREAPVCSPGFDPAGLVGIIARNVEIKRDVVGTDERERGRRQTLNLGHTIGHAIEAASDFTLGHGSCVAAGLCCMARASARLGWCGQDVADRIVACVEAYGLPTNTAIGHDALLEYATRDKKRRADGVTLVVPARIGEVELRRVSLEGLRRIIDLGCGG
ncbi:MAG: 3-dehydroquinate synthase [Coriobacteriaceae bacterium]|nr:3-dehydroquinate synthase [Coriobacteriaceae bacterium]MDD7584051.1 3-dehydroquinate synthase [Coriobacteriaceae bacterium]